MNGYKLINQGVNLLVNDVDTLLGGIQVEVVQRRILFTLSEPSENAQKNMGHCHSTHRARLPGRRLTKQN